MRRSIKAVAVLLFASLMSCYDGLLGPTIRPGTYLMREFRGQALPTTTSCSSDSLLSASVRFTLIDLGTKLEPRISWSQTGKLMPSGALFTIAGFGTYVKSDTVISATMTTSFTSDLTGKTETSTTSITFYQSQGALLRHNVGNECDAGYTERYEHVPPLGVEY